MEKFVFYSPTEIVFGQDSELKVADLVKKYNGHKVLIVYGGGSVKRTGLLDKVGKQLQQAGLDYVTLGGVQPNPLVSFVNKAVKQATCDKVDFILPIGGGSVIDTAKAIAHGLTHPECDIWDIWTGKVKLTKTTPFGSIVTLAAAGSETSDSAVLTHDDEQKKRGFSTPFNRAKFAILNPELTFTAPVNQKACGIADIMMHTLERYFAKEKNNVMTDYIAEGLLKDVMDHAITMLTHKTDYVSHSEIMYCGCISHNDLTGLGRTKDFSVHKFGHELSGKYGVTHGASLTAMWASWARYVYKDDVDRFAHLGKVLFNIEEQGELGAVATINKMEQFFYSLHLPINLSQLTGDVLSEQELVELTDMCTDNDTKKIGNFHPLNYQDVYTIYKMANH